MTCFQELLRLDSDNLSSSWVQDHAEDWEQGFSVHLDWVISE